MKHGKLIGLQTSAERLARVAVAAYDAATAPQTAPSGSISLDNADGTRTIIGPQAGSGDGAPSGQAIATHVGDTTPPPVPTGITAWSGDGSLHVMWDGTLSGDIPADFGHISILVDGEEVAQLSSAGSVTVGGVEAGATVSVTATAEDDACLADGTPAHNVSSPCAAIVVEIRDVAEEAREKADAHEGQIEAIQSDIEAYKQSATATYATKTEVDEKTGAITKTLTADYTKTDDLAATDAVKDAKKAGTDAQAAASAAQSTAQDAKKTADGISVGGRNLVLGTGVAATWTAPTIAAGSHKEWDSYDMVGAWNTIGVSADDPLTLTFDWAVTGAPAGATFRVGTSATPWEFFGLVVTLAAGSSSGHVAKTVAAPSGLPTSTGSKFRVRIDAVGNAIAAGMTVTLSHVKIERGNKATDWTPAPEDTDSAVADAKKAGTDAQSQLAGYRTSVEETYAEKTELTEAVNQLKSTMTSNYSAFTTYRTSNDTAVSKAQSDATNAQSTIDSYKTSNDQAVADAKAAGTTAQSQLSSYKSSNDAAVAAAKKAGTDAQSDLDAYRGTTDQRLDELQNVADNAIESWYLKGAPTTSNAPAKDWTTDALKKRHAGDLYMDTDTGYSYRWSGTEWVQVKDSDVTKALKEIQSVKTTYATKSELSATDTELSGRVSDALTTAKSYTDSSVEQEVTARNAAIKAQADSISLDVSRTYTRSETFAAYQSDADGRIATANSNASTAVSTAQTAASDAATAKTDASSAVSTANTASSNASNAVSTANAASSSASSAVSTANEAKTSAASAVSTANSANSTAGAAKSTADAAQAKADDAWARTLRVEVMSAPADADGDTSLLTAYAFRGGELLSDEAVARMGLLAWYVGGSRVATGGTYTCAAGTAAECRLEA